MTVATFKITMMRYGCILGIGLVTSISSSAHVVDPRDGTVVANEKIVVPNSGGVTTIRSNTPKITRQQV